MLSLAQASPPAGGAEIFQVIVATAAAALLAAALVAFGLAHRAGRATVLGRLAGFSERVSGLPGWAAIPSAVAAVSLISAVFGLYWDIALHADNGRDAGPLANPSHYFILGGLFGILAAGWIAMVLPEQRPGPAAVRLTRAWEVPVGGVVMVACASFALIGFPLDDVSHRLFGQDVTLWGTTHLMMLTGAAMTLVGILVILVEGALAGRAAHDKLRPGMARATFWVRVRTLRLIFAFGGVLIGLSIYQGEFDFGIPQFRLLYHPVLIAGAAAIALTAARLVGGRGAALGAVAFFLVVRGALSLWVGPIAGETVPHFPLYIAEALLIEALALRLEPAKRPFAFGALAGALAGTVGVLAEWGWSHVWMPIPWPAQIIPEAVALALVVAVAGGVIGAFVGGALRLRRDVVSRGGIAAAAASLVVVGGVIAYLGRTTVPEGATGTVTLTQVTPAPERTVHATVRFDPPAVAENADWLVTIAWQGKQRVVTDPLIRVREGVYRTSAPLPVSGSWKSALRLQRGDVLASIPVWMPRDPAIPAAEVPAPPHFERRLIADQQILQRERKDDVPVWVESVSGLTVLALTLGLLALLGWALARVARSAPVTPASPRSAPTHERELAGVA